MNYSKIHDDIIAKAISEKRKKNHGVYYEAHHIVPRSLGGSNKNSNMVLLTAREHFVIHKCLPLIYIKEDNLNAYHKMVHALNRFLYSKNSNSYKITSRDYVKIKEAHGVSISKALTGIVRSAETKQKVSDGLKKYYENNPGHFTGLTHSTETLKKMSAKRSGENNPQYGKARTEEECKKISNTMKGQKKSAETIEKFKNRKWSDEKKKQISESIKLWHAKRKTDREKQVDIDKEL